MYVYGPPILLAVIDRGSHLFGQDLAVVMGPPGPDTQGGWELLQEVHELGGVDRRVRLGVSVSVVHPRVLELVDLLDSHAHLAGARTERAWASVRGPRAMRAVYIDSICHLFVMILKNKRSK